LDIAMKVYSSETHQHHNPPYEGYNADGLIPALEVPERACNILAALQATTWAQVLSPRDFGLKPVLAVHAEPYLDYLRDAYQDWESFSPVAGMAFIPGTYGIDYESVASNTLTEEAGLFVLDTTVAITAGTYHAALVSANLALSGAEAIFQGQGAAFALCRPPGHHAGIEICGGYCFLNNAAIAAQWLSQHGKVAILDVDYHAGNGTQQIFYLRPDVFTVSLHADPAHEYPRYAGFAHQTGAGPGTGYHRNFPLPAGIDDAHYLEVLDQALALVDNYAPQHLVVSVGMDIYQDDQLGYFEITRDGIHQIGVRIAALDLPTLVVMEGGYHLASLGANMVAFLEPFAAQLSG
jgi:acetoin utilization deacetylase AcuC-like enzyme